MTLQWITFYAGWFVLGLCVVWNIWHAVRLNGLRKRINHQAARLYALEAHPAVSVPPLAPP